MRINRFLTLLAVLALTAALLPGCGGGSASGGVVPPSPGRSAQEPQSGSGTEAAEPAPAAPGESIQTNGGEVISLSALEHQDAASDTAVYYTSGISPEAMVAVYDALGVELAGDNIAVKLSTGEPPASNYLDPALIADLVHQVNGTIVENSAPAPPCTTRWRRITALPTLRTSWCWTRTAPSPYPWRAEPG